MPCSDRQLLIDTTMRQVVDLSNLCAGQSERSTQLAVLLVSEAGVRFVLKPRYSLSAAVDAAQLEKARARNDVELIDSRVNQSANAPASRSLSLVILVSQLSKRCAPATTSRSCTPSTSASCSCPWWWPTRSCSSASARSRSCHCSRSL